MNIAICDDERVFIEEISQRLSKVSKKRNIDCNLFTCQRGDALIELCKKENISAVFLDISMPGIDGFSTAKKLLETRKNLIIVFVSSKESMVFSSYEYNPFWFVPKSRISMLEIVIEKLFDKIDNDISESTYVNINVENKKVIEINLVEAAYFKTDDHYLCLINKNNVCSQSFRYKLDNIETQLSKYWFVRVHSRYLVNCRMISSISGSDCILTNNEKIPISRSKATHTKEIFQNYLRSIR